MGRNIQFFFMALVCELFFRKMRENHVHVGSKVYEGKTEQIFYHNGFEKIFEKAAKKPFASEVKCMRRETVVFSARFFCVKKLLEQCAKNPFMSEVRFMGREKPSNP